jgi:DNA-binding protein YbaB
VGLRISPETAGSGDVEMLEDLVKSAVAAAQRKAAEAVKAEMQKVTGGLNLPGLDDLLGGGE